MKTLRLFLAGGLTALILAALPGASHAQRPDCTLVAVGIGMYASDIRTALNGHLAGQRHELAMPGRYLTVHEVTRVIPRRNCGIEFQLRVELRRPALPNLRGTTIIEGTITELQPWSNDVAVLRSGAVRPCEVRIFNLWITDMGLGGIAGNLRNNLHRLHANRTLRRMEHFNIC
ncbi:MAG: hypothetical protein JJU19_12440 [Pararhodobacter sp.]|nr:hypothetical protein [Pararhodobacter sp.]